MQCPARPQAALLAALALVTTACDGAPQLAETQAADLPEPPPVVRLFQEPLSEDEREALDRLKDQAGTVIASLDASDPVEAREWQLYVTPGRLDYWPRGVVMKPAEKTRDGLTKLHFTPPEALPPSFRVELTLQTPEYLDAIPKRILWKSHLFPQFHRWRAAPPTLLDEADGKATRASFEALHWEDRAQTLRFDFIDRTKPVTIERIDVIAPPARNALVTEGGELWADIGGVAQRAVWAPTGSSKSARVVVPEGGELRFGLGRPTNPSRGAANELAALRFQVTATELDRPLFRRWLSVENSNAWREEVVDLSRFEGRELHLEFSVEGPEEAIGLWGTPRVVRRSAPEATPVADPKAPRLAEDANPATEPQNAGPPIVVLATWDTTRQSQLGLYGHPLDNTPFLDELAERSVVFENAFSQAPWTVPSMASMLTSQLPWRLGTSWGKAHRIPDRFHTLAETLGESGFTTAAFVANFVLGVDAGYAQGFDHYDYARHQMRDGADITRAALEWLDLHSEEPVLLFVHYVDPHSPYRPSLDDLRTLFPGADYASMNKPSYPPRAPEEAEKMLRRYEAEILGSDRHLQRLLEGVRRRTGRDPLLALTSDHGEEFLEHGFYGHGANLFAPQTHVPLLVSWPGKLPPGRVSATVRNLDVFPTILDLLGIEIPTDMAGTSLVPLAHGEALPLLAYSETNAHGPRRAAVRNDEFTYVTWEDWSPLTTPHEGTEAETANQLQAELRPRALYRGTDRSGQDVAGEHPEVVRRLQRAIDEVEIDRHEGVGLRLAAAREGEPTVVEGVVRVPNGRIVAPLTRMVDRGSDVFDLSEDATSLGFLIALPKGDEDWILFDVTPPDAEVHVAISRVTSELSILRGLDPVQSDGLSHLDEATLEPDVLLDAFEGLGDEQPRLQVWRTPPSAESLAAAEADTGDLTEDEIARLRALGYMR